MRVLLARPVTNNTEIVIPNLGLGYLARQLKIHGHDVDILDCAKLRYGFDDFRNFITKNRFDAVGIQIFTCDFSSSRRMIDIVKDHDDRIVTIAGGPHVSGLPDYTMSSIKSLDYGFCGESEIGLVKLCDYIAGSKNLFISDIPGLIYRNDGEVVINERAAVEELDNLEFPEWELINPLTYPDAPQGTFTKRLPVAPIVTSRGCPYECAYCGVKSNTGNQLRKRSPHNIISEIVMLTERYSVKEIHIEDDNFTFDKKRAIDFCNLLISNKINISWACPNGVRLDMLDEELLKLMERSGCYSFAIGIESGSSKILKDMNRKMSLNTLKEKVNLIASVTDIRMTGFTIAGYPTETPEDIEETIRLTLSLPISRVQYSNFLPLPGTKIFHSLIESGEISMKELEWDLFRDNKIAYSPRGMSPEKLSAIIKKGFFKFYFRPRIIFGLIKEIHSFKQFWAVLKRVFDIFK
jgi:radical SAM superfamily enzyme YgiQ (UPF0313 family)